MRHQVQGLQESPDVHGVCTTSMLAVHMHAWTRSPSSSARNAASIGRYKELAHRVIALRHGYDGVMDVGKARSFLRSFQARHFRGRHSILLLQAKDDVPAQQPTSAVGAPLKA